MSAPTTRDLLTAHGQGAVIVHRESGMPLMYRPRYRGDREPWRPEGSRVRYTAAECRAEGPNGGPWALAKLLTL